MKRFIFLCLSVILLGEILALSACERNARPQADGTDTAVTTPSTTEPPTEAPTEEVTAPATDLVIIAPGENRSSFRIVIDTKAEEPLTDQAQMLQTLLRDCTGGLLRIGDSAKVTDCEIVLGAFNRSDYAALTAELSEGEFAIRVQNADGGSSGQILLAATTDTAFRACMEYLLNNYYTQENGLCVPTDLDVRGRVKECNMITSDISYLRDPFILVEDGVYYAYGTGWVCYKNTSGRLDGHWKNLGTVASVSDSARDGGDHWAPEVHKYNGAYYMFTTYKHKETGRHGCTILKSDSPEGPFVEITGGHITPADWDAIDGTLYVDPDGQPWMVFVHEWISMPDQVGTFAAAKLSDDLTHFISEPFELFRADEPAWAAMGVTDGCFLYTTKEGDLLMLWSNFDASGYTLAIAKSSNGRLDGEWIHNLLPFYSQSMTGEYDGGHGMIFTALDGQMYVSFHSPNGAVGDRRETPVFLAVKEEDGMLVWAE